jgi:hypothetical protein
MPRFQQNLRFFIRYPPTNGSLNTEQATTISSSQNTVFRWLSLLSSRCMRSHCLPLLVRPSHPPWGWSIRINQYTGLNRGNSLSCENYLLMPQSIKNTETNRRHPIYYLTIWACIPRIMMVSPKSTSKSRTETESIQRLYQIHCLRILNLQLFRNHCIISLTFIESQDFSANPLSLLLNWWTGPQLIPLLINISVLFARWRAFSAAFCLDIFLVVRPTLWHPFRAWIPASFCLTSALWHQRSIPSRVLYQTLLHFIPCLWWRYPFVLLRMISLPLNPLH